MKVNINYHYNEFFRDSRILRKAPFLMNNQILLDALSKGLENPLRQGLNHIRLSLFSQYEEGTHNLAKISKIERIKHFTIGATELFLPGLNIVVTLMDRHMNAPEKKEEAPAPIKKDPRSAGKPHKDPETSPLLGKELNPKENDTPIEPIIENVEPNASDKVEKEQAMEEVLEEEQTLESDDLQQEEEAVSPEEIVSTEAIVKNKTEQLAEVEATSGNYLFQASSIDELVQVSQFQFGSDTMYPSSSKFLFTEAASGSEFTIATTRGWNASLYADGKQQSLYNRADLANEFVQKGFVRTEQKKEGENNQFYRLSKNVTKKLHSNSEKHGIDSAGALKLIQKLDSNGDLQLHFSTYGNLLELFWVDSNGDCEAIYDGQTLPMEKNTQDKTFFVPEPSEFIIPAKNNAYLVVLDSVASSSLKSRTQHEEKLQIVFDKEKVKRAILSGEGDIETPKLSSMKIRDRLSNVLRDEFTNLMSKTSPQAYHTNTIAVIKF